MRIGATVFACSIFGIAKAASARVAWKPNPENDIAGYRLQWSADGEPLREVETAAIFQPITGPRRFWWAEIETP